MQLSERISYLVTAVASQMLLKNWQIALAESCSGGQLAAALTSLPGSSNWFLYGLVTYANEAKNHFLDVPYELLKQHSAESAPVAKAMVAGIPMLHDKLFRLAITGFAGPKGERVGEVYIAWLLPYESIECASFHFLGDRLAVIQQTVYQALRQIILSSLYPLSAPVKCFFALNMEEQILQNQCLSLGLQLGLPIEALEPGNNLHLTLSYLNEDKPLDLGYFIALGDEVQKQTMTFSIELNQMQYWLKAKTLVLCPDNAPKALFVLAKALGASGDFKPHVSLCKKKTIDKVKSIPCAHTWAVKSFSLMISFQGVFYIEYKRWSLMAGNQNCSTQDNFDQ